MYRIWSRPEHRQCKGAHHFDTLKTHQLDPKWSLQRLLDNNPLVWMAEVNGILVDLRRMPREVQEIAFQKGMIPYIPGDRG